MLSAYGWSRLVRYVPGSSRGGALGVHSMTGQPIVFRNRERALGAMMQQPPLKYNGPTEGCPHTNDFLGWAREATKLAKTHGLDPAMVRVQLWCGCGQDPEVTAPDPVPPPDTGTITLSHPEPYPVLGEIHYRKNPNNGTPPSHNPTGAICGDCGSANVVPSGTCAKCLDCGSSVGGCS